MDRHKQQQQTKYHRGLNSCDWYSPECWHGRPLFIRSLPNTNIPVKTQSQCLMDHWWVGSCLHGKDHRVRPSSGPCSHTEVRLSGSCFGMFPDARNFWEVEREWIRCGNSMGIITQLSVNCESGCTWSAPFIGIPSPAQPHSETLLSSWQSPSSSQTHFLVSKAVTY